jgi:hypothetical protein
VPATQKKVISRKVISRKLMISIKVMKDVIRKWLLRICGSDTNQTQICEVKNWLR